MQWTMLKLQTHVCFKCDGEQHPDCSDEQRLPVRRRRPGTDDEPDESPDKNRAGQCRQLMCVLFGQDLRECELAQSAVRDRNNEHWNPGENVTNHESMPIAVP